MDQCLLTSAVMQDGTKVTTIEGLGTPKGPRSLRRAFIARDGYQYGSCTLGRVLPAAAGLAEIKAGVPRHVKRGLDARVAFYDDEAHERMSDEIGRCAAFPNMAATMRDAAGAAR